jgi:hypothetical protein
MRKVRAKRAQTANSNYLTKRVLKSAISAATRKASSEAMHSMGYVIKAENGWIIREDADGKKIQISKINQAHRKSIALD